MFTLYDFRKTVYKDAFGNVNSFNQKSTSKKHRRRVPMYVLCPGTATKLDF